MTDAPEITSAELARAKINTETARISWKELQRFFASGKTLYVEADLDHVPILLNDTAYHHTLSPLKSTLVFRDPLLRCQ